MKKKKAIKAAKKAKPVKRKIANTAKADTKEKAGKAKKKPGHFGIVIVNKGIEDAAALEIKELIGRAGDRKEGCVVFPIKDFAELALLSYKGQSFGRVLLLLDHFETDEQDPEKIASKTKADFRMAEELVKKDEIRFAARSSRITEQGYEKQDLERALGEKIHETYSKVDLTNPNMIFHCYNAGKDYYIGIDFSGEIDKREYRVYTTPKELKATIAYALSRIAGYDGKKTILDPFAGSGTIPIEAALFATNTSPRYFKKQNLQFTRFSRVKFDFARYEKKKEARGIHSSDASLHNLKCAEKNAKVASVNKAVNVSRIDIEWLDTKFDEHEIDIIASWPIEPSKEQDEKTVIKLYKELFYQADYILKRKCRIILIAKKQESITSLKESAKEYFKATHERQVMQGKETLNVIMFERK